MTIYIKIFFGGGGDFYTGRIKNKADALISVPSCVLLITILIIWRNNSNSLIWTETEQSLALMSTKAQPCCWRVAPQQSPFPRPAALQNYKIFVIQRNYEIKSLNLHRHLRSTGLSDLASDTLS